MAFVGIERYLALDFHRFAVDPDRHPDRSQRLHHGTIKICDRHRSEGNAATLAAIRLHAELMGDEIEIHLEVFLAIRHRPGGEAARGRVERHLPAMVEPRHAGKPDLAYDLHPHVQCFIGVLPRFVWQGGPLGMLHSGPSGFDRART
jgi:hypothetical protein